MIRTLRDTDIPRLKELENEYEFEFDGSYIGGLCAVDEHDSPVMFVGAWRRAEVHLVLDPKWSTPGARLFLLKELHDAMEVELRQKGVGQAVTWFGGEMKRFKMRLQGWGWIKSELTSWHRRII